MINMTPRLDLNKLAKEVFEQNKLKGWHDEEYSNEHFLCMVISELMEAVEADRKENRADLKGFYTYGGSERYLHDVNFVAAFEKHIKDSIEDELADAIIRLLDLAGVRNDEIIETESQNVYKYEYRKITFTECVFDIVCSYGSVRIELLPSIMIKRIEILCEVLSIDLWQHVELKLKYNLTRPNKHDKLY